MSQALCTSVCRSSAKATWKHHSRKRYGAAAKQQAPMLHNTALLLFVIAFPQLRFAAALRNCAFINRALNCTTKETRMAGSNKSTGPKEAKPAAKKSSSGKADGKDLAVRHAIAGNRRKHPKRIVARKSVSGKAPGRISEAAWKASQAEAEVESFFGNRSESGVPDLTIVFRYHENGASETKEYRTSHHHLARWSSYVEREAQSGQILFDGISPERFIRAIKYLEDPLASRSMDWNDVQSVLNVLNFYKRYEFQCGLDLCDGVLCEYFDISMPEVLTPFKGEQANFFSSEWPRGVFFSRIVECIVVALVNGLPKSCVLGTEFINATFSSSVRLLPLYTEDDFSKLRPLFQNGAIDTSPCEYLLHSSQEDMDSPLFSKNMKAAILAGSRVTTITGTCYLQGSGHESIDGVFKETKYKEFWKDIITREFSKKNKEAVTDLIKGETLSIRIKKERAHEYGEDCDWSIIARGIDTDEKFGKEYVLWRCQFSDHQRNLPCGPWDAIHPSVAGTSPIILE